MQPQHEDSATDEGEIESTFPVLGPDELGWLAKIAGLRRCSTIAPVARAWQAAVQQARIMPPFQVVPQAVITFDPARADALLDLNAVAALPDGGAITTQMNELLHVFNPEGVKVRTLGQLNYRSERMQAAYAQVDHDFRPDEFDTPAGVCAGGGFLYVLDTCRVIKMSRPGLSPVGFFTPADYPREAIMGIISGNADDFLDRTHPFAGAHALAHLNGHLFVSCAGHGWDAGRNAGISIIDVRSEQAPSLHLLEFIGRFPTGPGGAIGSGPGQWGTYPGGVAAFCGRIVVADPGNDRLQVFSDTGHFVREVGGITGGAGGPDRLSSSDMTQQLVVSSQDEFCVRVYNGVFHLVQQIAIVMRSRSLSRSPAAGIGVVGTGITVDGARMWVALSDLVESEANRGREMLAGKLALFVQAG